MLDQDVKIVRITEDRKLNDQQQTVPYLRIEFKVGTHGPFVEKFDKDVYTTQLRDDRINTFAASVRA